MVQRKNTRKDEMNKRGFTAVEFLICVEIICISIIILLISIARRANNETIRSSVEEAPTNTNRFQMADVSYPIKIDGPYCYEYDMKVMIDTQTELKYIVIRNGSAISMCRFDEGGIVR